MRFIVLNSVILLFLDIYIYKALRATDIKGAKTKLFSILWWTYSVLLFLGIIGTVYLDLRLTVRSIVLVALFITFVSSFVFGLFFLIAYISRRGLCLISRL